MSGSTSVGVAPATPLELFRLRSIASSLEMCAEHDPSRLRLSCGAIPLCLKQPRAARAFIPLTSLAEPNK